MKQKCKACGKKREVDNTRLQAIADGLIVKLRPSELKVIELRRPGTLCTDGKTHVWEAI